MSRAFALVAGAVLLVVTPAIPAYAQAEKAIEEVVVTARKREESLQKVPLAVSSVTSAQLQDAGVRTPLALGQLVPNLQTRGYPGSASIVTFSIRGQKAGDVLSTFDQAVGTYVDGIYIARPRGMNGAFFDLARVEVLKGPQGTLYGRNTTGGAINLISRDADYNGIHGFVGVDAGGLDLLAPRAAVNIPIIDNMLAVRVGYQGTFRDGFGKSAVTGQQIGQDRDQNFVRATVLFDPTPNLNFKLKAEHYRSRENGNLLTFRGVTPNATAAFAVAAQAGISAAAATARLNSMALTRGEDFDTTWMENPQHDFFTGTTIGLTITADLAENVQLKSITGYRKFENDQLFDLDGTEFRILQIGVGRFADGPEVRGAPGLPATAFQQNAGPEQRAKFFSQEFNLSGTSFGGRVNWLGGVYYSHELGNDTQHAQALPPLLANSFVYDGSKILNRSWSLYTQNDFKVTEQLTLTLGARYTEEHKYLTSLARNFFPNGAPATATTPAIAPNSITCLTGVPGVFPASETNRCYARNEKTWSGPSWLAGLSYQANDDVLVYARLAQGFRGGTFQLRSPLLAPANPEIARDIELGVKSDWLDGRLRLNAAGFRTTWENKQESILVPQADGRLTSVIRNAADATLYGFEIEAVAHPIDGLTLRSNLAYLTGEYDSFPGALRVSGGAPVDASGESFSDPPWSYSLGARYETPVGPGKLAVQADWSWVDGAQPSDRLINPAIPAALIDSFVSPCYNGACTNGRASVGLLNGTIDYRLDNGLTVGFFVTNLLDERYQVAAIDPSGLGGVITGISAEPRMWGFTIRKTFGDE